MGGGGTVTLLIEIALVLWILDHIGGIGAITSVFHSNEARYYDY